MSHKKHLVVPAALLAFTWGAHAGTVSFAPYASVDAQVARITSDVWLTNISGGEGGTPFVGATFSTGVYFGEGTGGDESVPGAHRLGIEAGGLSATKRIARSNAELLLVPMLASYDYNFFLPDRLGLVYLGPSVGAALLSTTISGGRRAGADSDTAFAAGAQVGMKLNLTENVLVGVGYRYLRMTDYHFDFGGGVRADLARVGGHFINAGITVVF